MHTIHRRRCPNGTSRTGSGRTASLASTVSSTTRRRTFCRPVPPLIPLYNTQRGITMSTCDWGASTPRARIGFAQRGWRCGVEDVGQFRTPTFSVLKTYQVAATIQTHKLNQKTGHSATPKNRPTREALLEMKSKKSGLSQQLNRKEGRTRCSLRRVSVFVCLAK